MKGLKRDEGRTWYSSHRGRLWIHAASKVPSDQEVGEVRDFYRDYYQGGCERFCFLSFPPPWRQTFSFLDTPFQMRIFPFRPLSLPAASSGVSTSSTACRR